MPHGLPQKTINEICGVLAQHPEVESAILYGSRAKGTHKPGSDIDLTLTGKGLTLKTLNQIDDEIDDLLLPWIIDLSIFNQIDNPELVNHINRNGSIFYQRSAIPPK